MNSPLRNRPAFSLVEVVLALAILSFAFTTIASLLPIGLRSNQSTVQQSRAANLLSLLDSDLRNTYPGANLGNSQTFGLTLPYKLVSGRVALKTTSDITTVPVTILSSAYTTGVSDNDAAVALSNSPTPYQASVIYTSVPATSTSGSSIQARLVISWPATSSSTVPVSQLVTGSGYVESFVTFPAP